MITIKIAVIYFSGTGNTEYVAKEFKGQLSERGAKCLLVDTSKRKGIKEEFDFYIFGGPTHLNRFPQYYIDWIEKNITYMEDKKAMIYSTGAEDVSGAPVSLKEVLEKKGFDIMLTGFIKMPNNYGPGMHERYSPEKVKELKETAKQKVRTLTERFLAGERHLEESTESSGETGCWKPAVFSNTWARDNLLVDHNLCVRCGKCAKNCPVRNITLSPEVTYKDKCIYCQRCVHSCPVNAIKY